MFCHVLPGFAMFCHVLPGFAFFSHSHLAVDLLFSPQVAPAAYGVKSSPAQSCFENLELLDGFFLVVFREFARVEL